MEILKTKTNELHSIQKNKYKKFISPIFFLGRMKRNNMSNFNYLSFKKLNNKKNKSDLENIRQENDKYLKIMKNDIQNLNKINLENQNIFSSHT